jgi:hypothetical protein
MNPIKAGLLPKWVTLLKIAIFDFPWIDLVAIKLAVIPSTRLIKFNRSTFPF